MPDIQAVFIDFGGVLYKQPDPRALYRVLRLFGVKDMTPFAMLATSPRESPFVADLWTGRTDESVVWETLRQHWGISPRTLAFLRRLGHRASHLDRTLVHFLTALRPAYRTAILTNAGTDFRGTFGAAFRLETLADHLIVSAEEGVCKPEPEIFHLAVERLNVRPEAAVFIDDLVENVEGARQVGLNAFLHKNSIETVAWLKEILNHPS